MLQPRQVILPTEFTSLEDEKMPVPLEGVSRAVALRVKRQKRGSVRAPGGGNRNGAFGGGWEAQAGAGKFSGGLT